jgi:hypothetical protein
MVVPISPHGRATWRYAGGHGEPSRECRGNDDNDALRYLLTITGFPLQICLVPEGQVASITWTKGIGVTRRGDAAARPMHQGG